MSTSYLNAPQWHDEAAAFKYVVDRVWPNGPTCPKCGEQKRVGKLEGKSTRTAGVYKCYVCRKPFTVRVGTIFEMIRHNPFTKQQHSPISMSEKINPAFLA